MSAWGAAGLVLALLAGPALAGAQSTCHPDEPDCSCGKLPVCIVSNSSLGFYSSLWFESDEPQWEGFGDEFDAHLAALQAEVDLAKALAQKVPCIEPVLMDAYQFSTFRAVDDAKEGGLFDERRAAQAANDAARLAAVEAKIDALFNEYGAGDFPWRNPELAQTQMTHRVLSCGAGMVKLKATTKYGNMSVSANVSSPMSSEEEANISGIRDTMAESIDSIAGDAAFLLKRWHAKLFSACTQVNAYCVTTNFDMANQTHECTTTTTCTSDGRVLSTSTETGPGIRAGGGIRYEAGCCGALEAVRNSTAAEDAETRKTVDQVWCPGGWNLRAGDLDCDGHANATDPTPWPPGEGPTGP